MPYDFFSFLPETAREQCATLLSERNVAVKVVRQRKTKHGDFRVQSGNIVGITLNAMENPYRFLLTFLHELAHYDVFFRAKSLRKPHGQEWKSTFQELTVPFLTPHFFPESLLFFLKKHMKNPRATFAADPKLMLALREFDPLNDKKCIFELEQDAVFYTDAGQIFRKGPKRRTRFLCTCLETKKQYLFPAFVEVKPE
ncbi:MAG: SprT-like domain-containing protein [Flavobacteriaceae bacterium]|jgi:hypothetical protein